MMQCLAALLLGTLLFSPPAAEAEPQFDFSGPPAGPPSGRPGGFQVPGGYLPPPPDHPPCEMMTKHAATRITTQVQSTTFVQGPGGRDSTSVYYTTQLVPATVFQPGRVPVGKTITQRYTSTIREDVTSTRVTTIGGVPVTRTVTVTNTRPQRVVSTDYETRHSSRFVTRTTNVIDYTTVARPVTVTRTDQRYVTSTSQYRGPDVSRTTTLTDRQQSTVQKQSPPRTVVATRTVQTTEVSTTTFQPRPSRVTRTQTEQKIDRTTRVTTLRDVVTRTQNVVSTVGNTVIRTSTNRVVVTSTREVGSTHRVYQTATRVTTQVRPTTIFDAQVVTRTETGRPVIRTTTAQRVVTITGQGGDRTKTSTRHTTAVVRVTTTISGAGRTRTTTLHRTSTHPCGQTAYNYDRPDGPAFSFP